MKSQPKDVHNFGGAVNSFLNVKNAKLTTSTLSIESISLPKSQPRKFFDPKKLDELQKSIIQHGILEPLIVRPIGEGVYELVAGERRLRAAKNLNLETVPVTVRELTENQALQVALIENLQREDLNPIEETKGILNLLALELSIGEDEVKKLLYQMQNETTGDSQNVLTNTENVEKIFSSLGKMTWPSFIKTRLVLLKLPEELIEAIEGGQLAYTKAQLIAQIKDDEQRKDFLEEAIAQDLSLSQIRDKVNEWKKEGQNPQKKGRRETYSQRTKAVYDKMKQKKLWKDSEKKIEFEDLLLKLEILLSD